MYTDDDFKRILRLSIIAVLIFVAVIGFSSVTLRKSICSKKYSSFPNRWEFFSGCQIEVDGKWIPADAYYWKEE